MTYIFRVFLLLLFITNCVNAQNYSDEINRYRENYIQEFINDKNSPLKENETKYLNFYAPDEQYKVVAAFELNKEAPVIEMNTSSGKIKRYLLYGSLTFQLNSTPLTLQIYQSEQLKNKEGFADYLFLPFTDKTNGTETYGGGRYLDFKTGDINNNQLIIDFNKAYNPYCAYTDGYSCPKPPRENALPVSINAGEKTFGKPHH